MTDEEKTALLVLGHSAISWDTREPVASYKLWQHLTDEEETAAKLLGFNATTFNKSPNPTKAPKYVGKAWSELTLEEQAAIRVLGFTQTLWDDGVSAAPKSYFKSWDELTVCGEAISVAHTIYTSFINCTIFYTLVFFSK